MLDSENLKTYIDLVFTKDNFFPLNVYISSLKLFPAVFVSHTRNVRSFLLTKAPHPAAIDTLCVNKRIFHMFCQIISKSIDMWLLNGWTNISIDY